MITREAIINDFLKYLYEVLNDPKLIDIAVKDHGSVTMHNRRVGLSELPKTYKNSQNQRMAGAFEENGEKDEKFCKSNGIVFLNEGRFSMASYDKDSQKKLLGKLPLKTRIILTAAIFYAEGKLQDQYEIYHDRIKQQQAEIEKSQGVGRYQENKEIQQLEQEWQNIVKQMNAVPLDIFKIWADQDGYVDFDLKKMKPATKLQSLLQRGAFQFPTTNIFISGGPHKNPDLDKDPHHFASIEPTISAFLDSLERHEIDDIIAIGKTFPYYAENDSNVVNPPDFLNYFIPNAKGLIKFQDNNGIPHKIESKPVKKVGRIITYEIRIDDASKPIFVHHFPQHDKQPLDLTENELAYIQSIQKKDKKVMAHCSGGKGGSGQMAYILASSLPPYSEMAPIERLGTLREVRTGTPSSLDFVETKSQEKYLTAPDFNEKLKKSTHFTPTSDIELDVYFQLLQLMQIEIENNKPKFVKEKLISKDTSAENKYIELVDLYNQFQFASSLEEAVKIFTLFQTSAISEPLRKMDTVNIRLLIKESTKLEDKHGSNQKDLPSQLAATIDLVQTIIKMNTSRTPIDTDNFFALAVRNLSLDDFEKLLKSINETTTTPEIDRRTYCIYLATAFIKKFDIRAGDEASIKNRRMALQFISQLMLETIEKVDLIVKDNKAQGKLREKADSLAKALLALERSCHPLPAPQPELKQNLKMEEEGDAPKLPSDRVFDPFKYAREYANYLIHIIHSSPLLLRGRDHEKKTFKSESQYRAELINADPFIKEQAFSVVVRNEPGREILLYLEEFYTKFHKSGNKDANQFREGIKDYLETKFKLDASPFTEKLKLFLETDTNLDLKKFYNQVQYYINLNLLQCAHSHRRSAAIGNKHLEQQLDNAKRIIASKAGTSNLEFQEILKHSLDFLKSEKLSSPELERIYNELNKAFARNHEPSIKLYLRKLIETLYKDKAMPAKIKKNLTETLTTIGLQETALLCLVNIVEDRAHDKILAASRGEERAALQAATQAAEKTERVQFQRDFQDKKHSLEAPKKTPSEPSQNKLVSSKAVSAPKIIGGEFQDKKHGLEEPKKTLSEPSQNIPVSSKAVSAPKIIVIDDNYFTHPSENKSHHLDDVLTQAAKNQIQLVVLVKEQTKISDLMEKIASRTPYLTQNVFIVREFSSSDIDSMKFEFHQQQKKKESKEEKDKVDVEVEFDPTLAILEKAFKEVDQDTSSYKPSDLIYISTTDENHLQNAKKEGFRFAYFSGIQSPKDSKPVDKPTLIQRLHELNYSMGYYNDMINILSTDPELSAPKVDVNPFNTQAIPNFGTIGFIATPIASHVSTTNFRKWIDFRLSFPQDAHEEAMLRTTLLQFMNSAVDRFSELTIDFQNSTALEVYRFLENQFNLVHEVLFNLRKDNKYMNEDTMAREFDKLKKHVNDLVELNHKYRENIGETYLTQELRKLQLLFVHHQREYPLIEQLGTKFVTDQESKPSFQQLRQFRTKAATTQIHKRIVYPELMQSQTYAVPDKSAHALIQNDPVFKERQTKTVEAQNERIKLQAQKLAGHFYKLENTQAPENIKDFTLKELDSLVNGITMPSFNDPKKLKEDFQKLLQLKMFFEAISELAKVHGVDAPNSIQKFLAICELEKQIKNRHDFKAWEFLEKAKLYLTSNKMSNNVVRKQLKVIENAEKTRDYIKAKESFISLGETREAWFWAKPQVNQYFDLFKQQNAETTDQKEIRILTKLTEKKK